MTAAAAWTCPTCRGRVSARYCGTCGEEALRPRHLSLPDLGRELFTAFTSVDGKLLRSLRQLLLRPGDLTVAYVEGRRKPYLGPLSLFLIANGLFFAVETLAQTNVFAASLDSHLHHQDWSGFAQAAVARRLAQAKTTLDAYAPRYNQAAGLNAKSAIILMVFAFSAVLPLAFPRDRRPFAAHVVFSLHLYGFLLILFSTVLAAEWASLSLGGPTAAFSVIDKAAFAFALSCCAIYFHRALGRAYGASGVLRVVRTLLLTTVVAALILGYRFTIFLITLATT